MSSARDTVVAARPRELWVDNLRVLVVAGVIVAHTATAYVTGISDWYYAERTTSQLWATALAFPAVAGGIFGLGPLFFLAGWFSPRSMAHRGPGGFARSRLLRLGVPLLGFVLLVQPLADYVGSRRDDVRPGLLSYLRATELSVMWFVAAILVFSLVYAGLRVVRPVAATRRRRRRRLEVLLAVAALVIALASLVVWRVYPWNSEALFSARPGEWPQGAVLFGLGVHAGEAGWLDDLSGALVRRLGWTALLGGVATVGMFAVLEVRGEAEAVLNEAAGWPTLLFAVLDGAVAVSLTVWFLAWVRQRWPTHGPLVAKAARGSYATYLLHPLVLTGVMVLLAPVPLSPLAKFVLVSGAGVVACFGVGYGATRVPGVGAVL